MTHFKNSYEECREHFISLIPGSHIESVQIPSRVDRDLFTDFVLIPSISGRTDKLVIISSGVHGVEGFVGSAMQSLFLDSFVKEKYPDLSFLLIHAINPYGFKHKRRVTENNVDLNRNFDISRDLFAQKNSGYDKVYGLLNPRSLPRKIPFLFKTLLAIAQHSMESLRRGMLSGQYQHREGVFFGGKDFEPQKEILEKNLLKYAEGYKDLLLIDLHTGYGKNGQLHLLTNGHSEKARKIFKGETESFYQVTGGFVDFCEKLLGKSHSFSGVYFEFGTLDSQKTLGSIEMAYRMIKENFLFHHTSEKNDKDFEEMFYPSSKEWREGASKNFMTLLERAMKDFLSE